MSSAVLVDFRCLCVCRRKGRRTTVAWQSPSELSTSRIVCRIMWNSQRGSSAYVVSSSCQGRPFYHHQTGFWSAASRSVDGASHPTNNVVRRIIIAFYHASEQRLSVVSGCCNRMPGQHRRTRAFCQAAVQPRSTLARVQGCSARTSSRQMMCHAACQWASVLVSEVALVSSGACTCTQHRADKQRAGRRIYTHRH